MYLASLLYVRHPLQAGYEHYELSNYALPGHACAHNLMYWHSRPFYGFGLGAASLLGGQRLSRPRAMSQYRCTQLTKTHAEGELRRDMLCQGHMSCNIGWSYCALWALSITQQLAGAPCSALLGQAGYTARTFWSCNSDHMCDAGSGFTAAARLPAAQRRTREAAWTGCWMRSCCSCGWGGA